MLLLFCCCCCLCVLCVCLFVVAVFFGLVFEVFFFFFTVARYRLIRTASGYSEGHIISLDTRVVTYVKDNR